MQEPDSALFFSIITEVLGDSSIFATKAIKTIKLVEKDHPYVDTLAIGKEGVIIVNKAFWRKNVKTRTDAKVVLIHELLHSILGDTSKLDKISKLELDLRNFTQDIRINASIHNFFLNTTERTQKNILDKMYSATGPMSLLRPRSNISKNSKFLLLYCSLYPNHFSNNWRIGRLQEKAEDIFKSEEALLHAIKILLPTTFVKNLAKVTLLGSHSKEGPEGEFQVVDGVTAEDLEGLSDEDKDSIIDGISNGFPKGSSNTYGLDGVLRDHMVAVVKSKKSLNLQLLKNFSCSAKVNSIRCMWKVPSRVTSVLPIRPSGKDMAMLAAGYIPTLWKNNVQRDKTENKNIAIYLDVSGSVGAHLPMILGFITSLKRNIQKVFCFSTYISEHTLQELNEGKFKSSGGTDFNPIVEHAIENKLDKIVIITDGHARVGHRHQQLAKKHIDDAAVVYFGNRNADNWWHQTYDKTFKLEELIN
jgi:hypothetical protein